MNISDWFRTLEVPGTLRMESVSWWSFLLLMGVSAITSTFVALLYRVFFRSRATGSEIYRAFPLIGVSITAIFINIQFSLPLSLGLLGALSIVRFRMPIKEPEEIAFLMLVVATSISVATFNLIFLGVLLFTSVATLGVVHFRRGALLPARTDGMLVLTLPAETWRARGRELLELLAHQLPKGRLDALTEGEQDAVVSYSFPALEQARVPELQAGWRALTPDARTDVYFTREATR